MLMISDTNILSQKSMWNVEADDDTRRVTQYNTIQILSEHATNVQAINTFVNVNVVCGK